MGATAGRGGHGMEIAGEVFRGYVWVAFAASASLATWAMLKAYRRRGRGL